MTIVAAYKISGVPLLIGDILLSKTGVEAHHIDLPTRDDVSSILPEDWQRNICGLFPKLVIINPFLAIGWTGTHIAAKTLLSEIRSTFGVLPFHGKEFIDFLKNHESLGTGIELTLIGWMPLNGNIVTFCWDSEKPNTVETGGQFFQGSGRTFFEKNIAEIVENKEPDGIAPFISASLQALGVISGLLTFEILSGENLGELFGGGYQIIIFHDGQFKFIDDYQIIPMIFTDWNSRSEFVLEQYDYDFALPNYMLKHKYIDNELVLIRTNFGNNNRKETRDNNSRKVFIVSEQIEDKKLSKEDLHNIMSISAKYYCCVPMLLNDDSGQYLMQTFCVPHTDKEWIYVENEEGQQVMRFSNKLINNILHAFNKQKMLYVIPDTDPKNPKMIINEIK